MKKFLIAAMLLLMSQCLFAQTDVTKFLGIPVDGTKEEMIQKLISKGFTSTTKLDIHNGGYSTSKTSGDLKGEFNGYNVELHIVTNNNKVCRIMVKDSYGVDESSIKKRFNTLCRQFENNPNYFIKRDFTISENEDISYEMLVHHKRYEASFYQKPDFTDTVAIAKLVEPIISAKYSNEELSNMTPEQLNEVMLSDPLLIQTMIEWMMKKSVWFMIGLDRGQYYILMYYDNEYNRANGEDL